MSGTAVSTRSERALITRARIVEAATTLFGERGYRGSSLRDIAGAAEISRPGLAKHFADKEQVLAAVLDSLGIVDPRVHAAGHAGWTNPDWEATTETAAGNLNRAAIIASLVGEASVWTHPAHARFAHRCVRVRDSTERRLAEGVQAGFISPARDPRGEATRLLAALDGLRLLQKYLPERVALEAMVEAHAASLAHPPAWRDREMTPPADAPGPIPGVFDLTASAIDGGYRPGREQRARIVADATALFAREGYADTSLSDIAQSVNVSKTALLHHFPSKIDLMRAVLIERDRTLAGRQPPTRPTRSVEALHGLILGATENAIWAPGLIQVYAVLSCEAAPSAHPAHDYFRHRFAAAVDYAVGLFRQAQADGDLPLHRDPEHEAMWFIALWDGLQYQWLYDHEAVDVAAQLAEHLDDVLGCPRPASDDPVGD